VIADGPEVGPGTQDFSILQVPFPGFAGGLDLGTVVDGARGFRKLIR